VFAARYVVNIIPYDLADMYCQPGSTNLAHYAHLPCVPKCSCVNTSERDFVRAGICRHLLLTIEAGQGCAIMVQPAPLMPHMRPSTRMCLLASHSSTNLLQLNCHSHRGTGPAAWRHGVMLVMRQDGLSMQGRRASIRARSCYCRYLTAASGRPDIILIMRQPCAVTWPSCVAW
jgi:hypothetical protein